MKVLLCTPYKPGPQDNHGGINIWAENILEHYHTFTSETDIHLIPFNRKNKIKSGIFERYRKGYLEYSKLINVAVKQLDNSFDVLHLCTSASISLIKDYILLKKAKHKGVKTVLHLHFGRIPQLIKQHNWEWLLFQKVMNYTDEAIVMDMKSFKALNDDGYKNVHYLPNPLSNAIMKQVDSEANTVKRDSSKISFVGHVIPDKGVYELVEACNKLQNIKLFIYGKVDSSVRAKMQQIANNENWLIFEGEVEHERVIRELLSTNIFVLPSYTEGFPNVILESMACGCATVATSVGAIPEMLAVDSLQPCGLCCDVKNVDELYNNIKFFIESPQNTSLFAERAVKRVNEMYVVQKVWEQLDGIWRELSEK